MFVWFGTTPIKSCLTQDISNKKFIHIEDAESNSSTIDPLYEKIVLEPSDDIVWIVHTKYLIFFTLYHISVYQ